MTRRIVYLLFVFLSMNTALFAQAPSLRAQSFHSGFPLAHDTYNAISVAGNGKVYYVLSSQSIDTGGQMYCYDPARNKISFCGDLTEACGEKGSKAIVQGKSHVRFVEYRGKLYFATHAGYYTMVDGMEKMGIAPAGYQAYPGGHFLTYDLHTGKYENLGIAPHGEGIITMNMDTARDMIYAITWPTGYFLTCDPRTKTVTEIGRVSGDGENGVGPNFRTLCRALAIDPVTGAVYMTNSEGSILKYVPGATSLERIDEDMKKDYFGIYDPSSPGNMGYNWRQIVYSPHDKCFYGVHGNSGYLFKFDPATETITVLDRITSMPSKASGMFDEFSYGYLGFILGPDKHTLYYLTGGPIYENGKRVKGKANTHMGEAKGVEDLHLITYDIINHRYKDHGAIFYPDGSRPLYVNAIAVGQDGTVYSLARIDDHGVETADLIKIENPFGNTTKRP